jgi:predicted MFS family arabinose efflux permease
MRARLAVLEHRSFRRLWLAHSGSVLGDMVILTALALYVTEEFGASSLGVVLLAQSLPFVLLLLAAGVVADRLPRHRLAMATDVVRAAVQAVVALLIAFDAAEVWHLVVLGALFGSAEAFYRPASTALVPETVPEDRVQEARALMGMSQNVGEVAGPAIGTALVVGLSAAAAFAVDAATFAVSALLLAGVRVRDRSGDRAAGEAVDEARAAGFRAELAEGWREVRSRQWVWAIIAGATFALLFGLAPLFVLGPTAAEEQYGGTAFYGVVLTVWGAGAVLGALTGLRWRPRHPMRVAQGLVWIWPLVGVALGLGAPVALVVVLALVAGWTVSLFEVLWFTALSERIPPHALSRVSAFDWMGSLALLPLGYALAGPVAEAVGTTEVLVAGGLATAAVEAAITFVPGVWRLEALPAAAADAAPEGLPASA